MAKIQLSGSVKLSMAQRPIFLPKREGGQLIVAVPIEFTWHAGMAKSQKQKSIRALHEAAQRTGVERILEISTKSESELGIRLSAFNLNVRGVSGSVAPVEVLFQGSKVFSSGGPYIDIYRKKPREAKTDERLKTSGRLTGFRYEGFDWPLTPQTAFYDWLYLTALIQNPALADQLSEYDGFSDIEFNPEKSINCQAAAAALYKALKARAILNMALSSPSEFIRICSDHTSSSRPVQKGLF